MSMHEAPQHIGFIMDGNRRFARHLMKQALFGHESGARKIEDVFDWCYEVGTKYITIYALSIENLDRPKKEFNFLMNLFEKEFLGVVKNKKIHERRVKINIIGRPDLLPKKVQDAMAKAVLATEQYDGLFLNIAVAYGGRQEILDAAAKIAQLVQSGEIKPDEITENVFRKNLYINETPDPDLIIRTSGEQRTSGFLLWQGAYAEYYFSKKCWPEFQKEEFLSAIADFNSRQRRFGK